MTTKNKILGLLFFTFLFTNCGVTTKNSFYYEPTIKRNAIQIRRVAIVPNRLPLNLTDPEKWRKHNWEIAADVFRNNGFDVVDYSTSVNKFERSGLPVEDTKSARDKYAELSKQLAVDIIIIPYYGTFATAKMALLFTTMEWQSVVTYQFYLADEDVFISRLDASGVDRYTSGLFLICGIAVSFADPMIGLVTQVVGLIVDFSQTLFKSNDSHWEKAFKKAITEGLNPFLSTYKNSSSSFFNSTEAEDLNFDDTDDTNETINYSIRAQVIKVQSNLLLIDKGSKDGIRIDDHCTIFQKSGEMGQGEIVKMKENRAIVKVVSGDNFERGDTVVVE